MRMPEPRPETTGGSRRRRVPLLILIVGLLLPAGSVHAQDAGGVYAIQGARLVPVTGRVIPSGTIVVRNGLIAALGARVTPPADAVVVDGDGLTVYPGFIDAYSQAGLTLPSGRDREYAGNIADRLATEVFDPGSEGLAAYRRQGFTTALVARNDGVFSGQAAVVDLAGDDVARMTVRQPVVQVMTYSSQNDYPGTLMAVVAYQRQTLIDATYLDLLRARYQKDPKGTERPASDPALEALIPVARGQAPVLVEIHTENDFIRLKRLADEFGIRYMIAGAQEAYRDIGRVREMGVPVVVSLDYPALPRTTGYNFGRAFQNLTAEERKAMDEADTGRIHGNAGMLADAGLQIALSTSGMRDPGAFLSNLRTAVKAGLPADKALEALTVNPARLYGVAGTMGSLEVGKAANLTVTHGDPFTDDDSYVAYLFVDGMMEGFEAPRARPSGPAGSADGTWSLTLEVEGEMMPMTLTISQAGGQVKGMLATGMGPDLDVTGSMQGDRLTCSGSMEGESLTLTATVSGDKLNGSIAVAGQGSFPVTGTKTPLSEPSSGRRGS